MHLSTWPIVGEQNPGVLETKPTSETGGWAGVGCANGVLLSACPSGPGLWAQA